MVGIISCGDYLVCLNCTCQLVDRPLSNPLSPQNPLLGGVPVGWGGSDLRSNNLALNADITGIECVNSQGIEEWWVAEIYPPRLRHPSEEGILREGCDIVRVATLRRSIELMEQAQDSEKLEAQMDSAEGLFDRGNELLELGRFEEAIASFDRVTEIKPNFYEAWCERGFALLNLDKNEDAISSFNQAIKIKIDSHEA